MFNSLMQSGGPLRLLAKPSRGFVNSWANFSQDHQEGPPSSAQTESRKPPPETPNPEECCGTGCSDCTYLKYAEELVDYYKDGGAVALQEVDKIADPTVRVFVKTEIKFYLDLDQDMREVIKKRREESMTKPQE